MTGAAIAMMKALIAVIAAAGLFMQAVLLPDQASYFAAINPEVAFLETPMLILAIVFIGCGQVVLACVWVLLSLVRRETIWSERAFGYLDVTIGALLAAVVVVLAAYLTAQAAQAVPPALFLFTVAASVGCMGLAIAVGAMRRRLVRAVKHKRYVAQAV